MQTKNVLIALITLSAVGLGACSKNNKNSLKARAEAHKATGNVSGMNGDFEDANKSIEKDRNDLSILGVPMGSAATDSVKNAVGSVSVKSEDRQKVIQKLHNVIDKAETQIGLAKELKDDKKKASAEDTKKEARYYLNALEAQDQKEQAEKQKQAEKNGESKESKEQTEKKGWFRR